MVSRGRRFFAFAGFAALLFLPFALAAMPPEGPTAPALGSAVSFAVLGGSAVTSAQDTIVAGNVGVSPGNTITGISSRSFSLGGIHRNDPLAKDAQRDSAAAYADLAARRCGATSPIDPTLSGTTRTAGVYCFGSDARLEGVLTLDAGGNRDAVWIFKVPGVLTAGARSSVVVINGGYDGNVFWQVGATATLGEESALKGNILARTGIVLHRGARLSGRALVQQGAVTLDDNNVSLCCAPIAVTPATLPDGIAGTAYNQMLAAAGGTESFTFSTTPLPDGLSLTGKVLSGMPAAGVHTFTVTATDTVTGCTGGRTYTIHVSSCALTILPEALPRGVAGEDYEVAFEASGGSGSYGFSVTSQPVGWSLTFTDNVLSGALPVVAGSYTFTVRVRDLVAGCTESKTYTVIVDPCPLTVLPLTLPRGTVDADYPATEITASGGDTLVTTSLPEGLAFAGKVLYGTPKSAGVYPWTVTATNTVGCSGFRDYTIVICPAALSPPILPAGTVGTRYDETIAFIGATRPSFSREGPLPPGLDLDRDGSLTGTATMAGHYCSTVTAVDENGCSAKQDYCIDVVCPTLVLSPSTLPGARVGKPYDHTVVVSVGTPPYAITVSPDPPSADLGATITPPSVQISGTPTAPGDVVFTITATDRYGCTVSRLYTIHVTVSPTGTGVPALSPWAMLLLSILLGGAAFLLLARRGI